ncbi:hypothetical protein [Methylobacterium sp. Leaf456]|uniref:hypothetical protein n=1 Tax=Methylobacterium sp. Leaf456 TaxID=1736382 RepID=UPI0007011F9F|nr:hypothetical protein [Methylobacterium sp. Leaf456]
MDDEEIERETQIHNEPVELLAACLNIIAAGLTVTGVIGPFTTIGMRIAPGTTIDERALALMLVWIAGGIVLLLAASLVLRNLR